MYEKNFAPDALVQAIFFTNEAEYVIPKLEYSIQLTSSPEKLQTLVKALIIQENNEANLKEVDFEFLINGKIFNNSIEEYLKLNNLTTENVLEIEYIKKLPSPNPRTLHKHNDWVSSLDIINIDKSNSKITTYILTGCYDNTLNIWSQDGNKSKTPIFSKLIHDGPVKDIKFVCTQSPHFKNFAFLTASHDQTVKYWKIEKRINKKELTEIHDGTNWVLQCITINRGHLGGVECVSIQPLEKGANPNALFCSGSWDKMVKIWRFEPDMNAKDLKTNQAITKKNKRINIPILTIAHHDEVVSTIQWIQENEICSASWDCTIKIWDVEAQKTKTTLVGQKSFLNISYSPLSQLIISGSTDSHVRLWDPRTDVGTIVKCAFSSHKGWVSCVKWSPNNINQFTSGSYDSIVKIWDVRSVKTPLFNLYGQKEKILCNAWTQDNLIVNGGSDNTLQIFQI
ncbi:unnamed protein product [Gordionus sp. m RMFG-2023]|uniref:ribosome biogenesis protein WDR12 homolog n=1 Tax=Gordionus sp. m RMFG-2023 TaxID=3053472 RepID=UPI0030E59A77